jgi:hypothetical protein
VGGKEVALRLTGFVYQIVFMEYNMMQRGKDWGSWPDLKRQSDAIVPAFAKFMWRGERQIRRGLSASTSSAASTPVRYAPT